ncbi:hypothetical protein FQA39_LY10574 [Lamprigera yunnana]|nr:hypothetical protein FQA39_LY10574 [Lamprigera yunnana]
MNFLRPYIKRRQRFSNVADVVVDDSATQDTDNIIDVSDDCTIEDEEETTETSTNKEHEPFISLSHKN